MLATHSRALSVKRGGIDAGRLGVGRGCAPPKRNASAIWRENRGHLKFFARGTKAALAELRVLRESVCARHLTKENAHENRFVQLCAHHPKSLSMGLRRVGNRRSDVCKLHN